MWPFVGGMGGLLLASHLSYSPPGLRPSLHSGRPWQPHPEPGTADLIAAGVRGAVRAGVTLAERAVDALTHPDHALARAREAAEGIGEIIWAGMNPAPGTPLNVPIGPHPRFLGIA